MVCGVRLAVGMRAVPARGSWFTGTASPAAVMSGPFTEDVRGDLWQPLPRKSDDTASKRCPAGESDDCEPDSGAGEVPEDEGDAAESRP